MIGVGEEFPEFYMQAVSGDEIIDYDFEDLYNQWSVIYFYPKDFTFICPTEIQGFDNLVGIVDNVVGISPDNEYCKLAWKQHNELVELICPTHILAADSDNELANILGIVSGEGVPYRATYVIDPENIIQHVSVNALDTGRNPEEIYRTIEALKADGLTGCSWQNGDDFVA
jgi:peroxiredoxin (alkyl hydroperoxide reductase subunit C)